MMAKKTSQTNTTAFAFANSENFISGNNAIWTSKLNIFCFIVSDIFLTNFEFILCQWICNN